MGLEFTWIDAVMIVFIFITFGLVSGKHEYEKKLTKEKDTDE